jgi:hypothetical protein
MYEELEKASERQKQNYSRGQYGRIVTHRAVATEERGIYGNLNCVDYCIRMTYLKEHGTFRTNTFMRDAGEG